MTVPHWTAALLRRLAPPDRVEDILGDLEETHRRRVERRGRLLGSFLTAIETFDIAVTLVWRRLVRRRGHRATPVPVLPKPSRVPMPFSWLDFKLGVRMLVKYPGLTIIGVCAIAFAIAVGTGTFVFVVDATRPTIPGMENGDRLVEIRYRDLSSGGLEQRVAFDLRVWRDELQTVDGLTAYRDTRRNMETEGGVPAPVRGTEIAASAFEMVTVPPRLGRTLTAADGQLGAPPVVVLGYDVWQSRFDGSRDVIGRAVRFGAESHTVVGVMPDGFAFPDESQWWTPLRLRVGDYEPGQGPSIQVFGWLTDGASLDDVRRELIPLANNAAARFPDTHGHLRPEVQPFGTIFMGVSELGVHSLSTLFFLALLTLISANIALLVFARTAMRESEIIVRTALGASRRRIVMQLFAEALVLGIVAAVVGLMAANTGLNWVIETMEHVGIGLPYWFHRRLTPAAVLYAGVFTVVAAVVIGVIPALKATGRRSQSRLQHVGARGSTLQMGGVWTAVVVIQVAFTVFAGRVAIELGLDTNEIRTTDLMFAADEFVSARVAMDPLPPSGSPEDTSRTAFAAAFQAAYTELGRAVAAQPGVRGVTFADQDPGAFHPRGSIDIEDVPVPDGTSVHRAQMAAVDLSFFEAVGAPIVAGRSFSLADGDAQVVIVNESFVRDILDGRNAVGRHLRYRNPDRPSWPASTDQVPGPWLEIVGVVRDVAMTVDPDLPHGAGIYHLLSPGAPAGARWHAGEPVRMAVHVAGNPAEFASTLGSVVASVDPALEIDDVRTMDRAAESLLRTYDAWFRVVVLTGALAMILSNTGIYAVMSFAVSRRTREIGVRVALGATATRIVTAIFSRSLAQVALGVLVGGVLLVALGAVRTTPRSMALFGTYIAVMMIVCLLSCIVPTRRALTIEPTEALKE